MQANKSMNEINLPIPSHENMPAEFYRAIKIDLEVRTFFKENIDKLNIENDKICTTLKPLINRDEGRLFMIDSPGGT